MKIVKFDESDFEKVRLSDTAEFVDGGYTVPLFSVPEENTPSCPCGRCVCQDDS